MLIPKTSKINVDSLNSKFGMKCVSLSLDSRSLIIAVIPKGETLQQQSASFQGIQSL